MSKTFQPPRTDRLVDTILPVVSFQTLSQCHQHCLNQLSFDFCRFKLYQMRHRPDKSLAPHTIPATLPQTTTLCQSTQTRAARFGEGRETSGGCADAPERVEVEPEAAVFAADGFDLACSGG